MTAFSQIFFAVLCSLLNFLPYLAFMLRLFREKLRYSVRVTAVFIALLSACVIFLNVLSAGPLNPLADMISLLDAVLYLLTACALIEEPVGKTVFCLLTLCNIANFITTASKCLEGFLCPALAGELYTWLSALCMATVELVVLLPLAVAINRRYRKILTSAQPIGWVYLWIIPATFYLIWYYTFYYGTDRSSLSLALDPKISAYLFCLNACMLLICHVILKFVEEQQKNAALQAQKHLLNIVNIQYKSLERQVEDARVARHDMRHHLLIINDLLLREDYKGLSDYLKPFLESLPQLDRPLVYCPHAITNTILSYCAYLCDSRGITFTARAELPETLPIQNHYWGTLLNNLLENACDAAGSCLPDNRRVEFCASVEKGNFLVLSVRNTYKPPLLPNGNGLFQTTKEHGSGLGLLSVQRITDHYNGTMKLHYDDSLFTADIFLNLSADSTCRTGG